MKTPAEYYSAALLKGQAQGWGAEAVAMEALRQQQKDWQATQKSKVLALVTTANQLPR